MIEKFKYNKTLTLIKIQNTLKSKYFYIKRKNKKFFKKLKNEVI